MRCLIPAFAALVLLAAPARPDGGDMEASLATAHAAGELQGLHSVLVLKDGEIFAEAHFPGEDEAWGTSVGLREHGPHTLHDLRSVTKSITSLLYGIALADGLVPPPDAPLAAQFPYPELAADPEREGILVRHALTMTMGLAWDESLPYSDPRNSEIAMEQADDRYRFVLDRPVVAEPGTRWIYSGGATALIARLIADGAGMPLDRFAEERLFGPLGITRYEWARGSDGEPSAASGLRLTVRDLARIGQLILDDGRAGGRQIVPEAWLTASFAPAVRLDPLRYGYYWWLAPEGDPPVWVAGFGNGGQRLSVNRARRLVFVVFAGNYNQSDAWQLPHRISLEHLAPVLEAN